MRISIAIAMVVCTDSNTAQPEEWNSGSSDISQSTASTGGQQRENDQTG